MSKNIKKWFICCLVLSLLFTLFPQMSVWAENTEQPAQSEVSEGEECVVLAEADKEETGVSEEPVVSVEEVAPYVILADGETLPQTKADEVSVLSDDVVQLETEDALYQYLKEQVVVRNSQITVSVPVEINNKVGPINAMTSAQKYTEACTGQEGDALKYGGVGYSVSTTSYSGAARVTYTYYMNYYTTAEQEKQLTSAVTSALASLNLDGKTEAEKVVAIHNYICDHVDYDYDGLSDSSNTVKYTAYGALCNGKAVCNGYAVLFYRMCKEAGLSVRIISGTANGGSHAWNIVKVGDVYYAVDSTWDGQDAQTLDQYLLKSEKDFSADHTRSAEYTTEEFNDAYPMALNSYYEKTFNDSLNRDNPQYDNVALDGTTVATVSFSKPKILIYFSTQCGYSQATIGEISKNTYTGADIVAVAVNTTSVDDVTAFKNTYGNDDICFAYKNVEDSPIAQNQMWSYVHMNTSATQISFPVIVYIDSNNKVQNVTTGYQALSDIEENMQHYCGVISDGNVYTIKYNPNGGTGDSIRKTYPVNTTAVVEECTYAKDGYSFSGWNTKADGSGTGYKPGDAISSPKSNIVLYAQWNANVTLDNVVLGEFINTSSGVRINWKAVANAKTYQIYRKTQEGKWTTLTNKETGTTYTDTTAENGKTYYYTVRALNGDMRSPSYDGNKKITCIRTLGNVELGEFKNTSDGVQINWKAVANAKRYQIYRKTPEGKWTTLTNKETGTTYTDTTAENGKTYYYTVRALNGDMRSPSYDGNKKITCIRTLGNVELGEFKNTSDGVQINWKAVANAKRYQIYRKTPEGKWTTLTNKETGTTYTDTTAENGKTYYYTVRALNGDMRSPSYDGNKKITCIRTLGDVELGEFKNTSDGVQINWKAVANAKTYQVYRKTPEGKWNLLTNKETGTTYTDTTAENGKTYYYTVRALNGDMRSPSYDASKSITYKKPSVEVPQTTFSKTSGNVTFKVQYPENITCGTPTTFKLSSEGTTDKVQYALYSLTTEDGTIVYDTSYGSNGKFFSKDSFDFTFYASGTYYIRFAIMDTGVSPYVWFNTGLYGIKLVIDDKGYPTVENVVADLKAQCEKTCTTDFEKAVWFNDWLVENCRYDFSYSYCAPEGALARGLGTCEAYHRAYVMLLNSVGIATDRISGDGHVWTGVQLDGNWYHIDTTWDDAGYEDNSVDLQHLYFGLNDELMNQIHSSVTSSNGISAHSLEDNYFIKTGKIKKWSDQYVSTIREHLNNGENTFDITINDSMIDSYKQIIYYLVAYQLSNTDWSGEKLMVTYSQNMLHCVVE